MSEQVQQLFNDIAPVYDRLNDELSFGLHRVWKQTAVKWSGAQGGDRALDLCCGSGDLSRLLLRTVGPGGQVVGLDFAAQQLAIAAEKTKKQFPQGGDRCQWIEGDALDLPFPDGDFDAITMGYGLRNVDDIPRALGEIRRVLKPGKKAAILDFHRATNPVVQQFQRWYLERFVVPAADRLGCREEYEYIWSSLAQFPQKSQQVAIARDTGFRHGVHYDLAGGLMGVLVVTK